jgi:hypothetical protein
MAHPLPEEQDDFMPDLTLTETPATMSPHSHHSLTTHLDTLASESDDWEDDEEDQDHEAIGFKGMDDHMRDITRRTIQELRRAHWGDDFDDFDDSDLEPYHIVAGREKAMEAMKDAGRLLALNPYKSSLTSADVESCVVLENTCFPAELAATRERVGCHFVIYFGGM